MPTLIYLKNQYQSLFFCVFLCYFFITAAFNCREDYIGFCIERANCQPDYYFGSDDCNGAGEICCAHAGRRPLSQPKSSQTFKGFQQKSVGDVKYVMNNNFGHNFASHENQDINAYNDINEYNDINLYGSFSTNVLY